MTILGEAREAGGATLAPSRWRAAVGDVLGDARADELRAAFESGAPIPLRAGELDPCVRLVPRQVHAFTLGFALARADAATIEAVDAAGPAQRAGLRVGDVVEALEYAADRSDVPVRLRVSRDGQAIELEYLPRGEARRARALALAPRRGACALD
jgi:predicted metalloprotease with PDZ domain